MENTFADSWVQDDKLENCTVKVKKNRIMANFLNGFGFGSLK